MDKGAVRIAACGRTGVFRLLLAGGLLTILAAGLLLRFWHFSSLSLTYDELTSWGLNIGAPDVLTCQSLINMYVPDQMPLF